MSYAQSCDSSRQIKAVSCCKFATTPQSTVNMQEFCAPAISCVQKSPHVWHFYFVCRTNSVCKRTGPRSPRPYGCAALNRLKFGVRGQGGPGVRSASARAPAGRHVSSVCRLTMARRMTSDPGDKFDDDPQEYFFLAIEKDRPPQEYFSSAAEKGRRRQSTCRVLFGHVCFRTFGAEYLQSTFFFEPAREYLRRVLWIREPWREDLAV